MKKTRKYFYNTATHRFEKWVVPLRVKLLRLFGFLSASTVTGLLLASAAFRFLVSPSEQRSQQDIQELNERYASLQRELSTVDKQIGELEERDNGIYRAIFAAAPLPDSVRLGKSYAKLAREKYRYQTTDDLIRLMQLQVGAMQQRIAAQQRSDDTLEQLVKAKEEMIASIPAIQPVSNKDLSHIASGFGYRIDPIYKTPKLHTGLDFAAAIGTPIYATANGKIESTGFDEGGYGNHVIINHGYGYETLYGHMVRVKARPGEAVKRGALIGWVGSTGKSTGPHCHYEVIRNGEKIDPVHYFFNDLSAGEYERLVKIAASTNQAFD